jgi:hypothetical protein
LISTWGTGNLYEHGVLEVPLSYGKNVRFFKRLSFKEASNTKRLLVALLTYSWRSAMMGSKRDALFCEQFAIWGYSGHP